MPKLTLVAGLVLAATLARAEELPPLPPQPNDKQCESYVNALGRQGGAGWGDRVAAVITGPCAAAFEREMYKQMELQERDRDRARNSL